MASKIPLKLTTGGSPKCEEFGSTDTVPDSNLSSNVVLLASSQALTNKDATDASNKLYIPSWAKREYHVLADPGATTFSSVGMKAAPTVSGTPASGSNDAAGPFARLSTSASANDVAGIITASFDYTQRQWNPEFVALVRTHTSISSIRILCGWADQNIDALAVEPSTQHSCYWRYDTGLDTTGQWSTVSSDGSTHETNLSAGGIATSTAYLLRILLDSAAAKAFFYLNDTLVETHTAHIPGATTNLGFFARVIDLTASARALQIGRISHRMK